MAMKLEFQRIEETQDLDPALMPMEDLIEEIEEINNMVAIKNVKVGIDLEKAYEE